MKSRVEVEGLEIYSSIVGILNLLENTKAEIFPVFCHFIKYTDNGSGLFTEIF